MAENIFQSEHFELHEVGKGIFAAIHREDGWAIGNAGIVDLGGHTLIFDTFMTPQAAHDLRTAALSLFNQPIRFVVNSHYHNDHVWGNQVFDTNVQIIATAATRRLLQESNEQSWYGQHAPGRLKDLRRQLDDSEAGQRRRLTRAVSYYEAINGALPDLQIRLPDITFEKQLDLYGTQRSVSLITYGGGHTGSDSILHVADAGVVFTADLLFVGCHPYLPDGNPSDLVLGLNQIERLAPQILIPGHGAPGNMDDLRLMKEYVGLTMEQALDELVMGIEEDELDAAIAALSVPPAFSSWSFRSFYADNMRFLYHLLRDLV
jgi:glyoxylase-like metal-dependent hydrolase (beta-lactamase superfamily II)